jgi:hypothetical protein
MFFLQTRRVAVKITCAFVTKDGAMIAISDGKEHRIIVAFGKDELRRTMSEHVPADPKGNVVLQDLEEFELPGVAVKKTLIVEGTAVMTIHHMLEDAIRFAGTSPSFVNGPKELYYFFTSKDPSAEDAILGIADERAEQRLIIFYSKSQVRQYLRRIPWLSSKQRRSLEEKNRASSLPEASTRDSIEITGSVAAGINIGRILRKMADSQN